MTVLFDGQLWVHYAYFDVVPSGEFVEDLIAARRGQRNGLLGAQEPHRLGGITGLHTGEVAFRVEWTETEPSIGSEWEDVVEASIDIRDGDYALDSFDHSHPLNIPRSGWHRARYNLRAMDAGRDMDTPGENQTAPDSYLLQFWPAPPSPDAILKQTSRNAAYWHTVPAR
ncbi:hypothetical protein [Promicromonospora sukumoe]|uniref:hypothetical protein n=1 Tax=Promicromonospora sukumoe TaxID=88382 RepID=UPI00037C4832|nr:hypothetical protein [Promicromonospora sukumoe]